MKSILVLLLAGALCASTQAQSLLLSDFSNFTPGYYSQAFEGPWSEATAFSGSTSFSIADFGNGTPTDSAGNAFIQWLGDTPQDWSSYSTIELSGRTLGGNLAPSLNFYVEDVFGQTALTAFTLGDFVNGLTNVSPLLNFAGVDSSQVSFWGFQVNGFDFPAASFAFEFDRAALGAASAVPEPSTLALVYGLAALGLAAARLWSRRPSA